MSTRSLQEAINFSQENNNLPIWETGEYFSYYVGFLTPELKSGDAAYWTTINGEWPLYA